MLHVSYHAELRFQEGFSSAGTFYSGPMDAVSKASGCIFRYTSKSTTVALGERLGYHVLSCLLVVVVADQLCIRTKDKAHTYMTEVISRTCTSGGGVTLSSSYACSASPYQFLNHTSIGSRAFDYAGC